MISYRLFGRSLFDFQLKSRGYDLSHGRDPLILDTLSIRSITHTDFISIKLDTSSALVIEQIVNARGSEAYVIDHENHFVGDIRLADLLIHTRENPDSTPIDTIVNTDGLRLGPSDSVWSAMHKIKGFVGAAVPVVDPQSEQMLGIIYETDLIDAYMRTLRELRNEETANA